MGTTEQLAGFLVRTTLDGVPEETVERAKELMVDFITGALAGRDTPVGRLAADYTRAMDARPEARVIGYGFKTTAAYASFANAILNHAPELEAVSQRSAPASGCPFAVSLALGEKLGLSGAAVLEGCILGFEIQGRVGAAAMAGASKRGRVLIFSHLGSAAAACKLLGLSEEQTRMALGIAASQAGGLLPAHTGTMQHYMEFGISCRDGVEAADLAREGATASRDIIEAPGGFCDALVGEGGYDLPQMTADLGKRFQLSHPGVSIKKYPCCYRSHCALDALFDLLGEHHLSYEDIESVAIDINAYDASLMKFAQPATGDEARFSYPHVLGAAILEGRVWLDSFTDESVASTRYQEARSRVKVLVHPEWPAGRGQADTPVTVALRNGRVYSKEASRPRDPTRDELLARYRHSGQGVLSEKQTEASLEMLLRLEQVQQVDELTALLAGGG